jgi:16S rRNA (uracil1498-N3)-methyltransferase
VVERDDRAMVGTKGPITTFVVAGGLTAGTVISLDEPAAHHARVKRLDRGDAIRLTDGAGRVAFGRLIEIDKRAASVEVDKIHRVPQPGAIHLRVPIGDRDRMLWLAEKTTELGIASWQGVRFRRSMSVSPRGEGPAFAAKVRARMVAALEQSGGAWLPRIEPDIALDALEPAVEGQPLLLDANGGPMLEVLADSRGREPMLLFGPEGGLDDDEREQLRERGWRAVRLASTTLRFETAGVAAVAVVRAVSITGEA